MLTMGQFTARMDQLAAGEFARDLEPALQGCVAVVAEDIEQHFTDKIDSEGQAWPAHSPVTVALYGAHPLLVLSGLLKAAAAERGFGSFVFVGADVLRYGVNKDRIPYAGVHQFGYPAKNIPAREYMYLSDEAIRACGSILVSHAAGAVL